MPGAKRRENPTSVVQEKQDEWAWQWSHFEDDSRWLFSEWIRPLEIEDFREKTVLDCGCGGGQHLSFVAPVCRRAVGVDLNAIAIASERTRSFDNVELIEADLADLDLDERFDITYSIGVLHHTDDPTRSFEVVKRHCRPGGRVAVWVYSHEGNFLNRTLVESAKRLFLHKLSRSAIRTLAHVLTALVYVPVHTVYRLPIRFAPYYEYFCNWRKLPYRRNLLNVFDKLNAPQTHFITRSQVESWFAHGFENVHITPYKGVSWRASGTKESE